MAYTKITIKKVAFTGDTTNASTTVINVSVTDSVIDLAIGDIVKGPGIPDDTRISNIVSTTITLDKAATADGTGVALTALSDRIVSDKTMGLYEAVTLNGREFDGTQDISIPGAITDANAPSNPEDGDLWWDSTDGNLYVYYDDGVSAQWIEAVYTTGGGGGTPGGTDTTIQYNNNGAFAGASTLTWDETNSELTLDGKLNTTDIQLDTNNTGAGRIFFDDTEGVPQVTLSNNVTMAVGFDSLLKIYNNTGSAFSDGQFVHDSGHVSGFISVELAQADLLATSENVLGCVTEPIADGTTGFVTQHGYVGGLIIDPAVYTHNDKIYLSADTPGAFTNVKPSAPDHIVELGWIHKLSTDGSTADGQIYVDIHTIPLSSDVLYDNSDAFLVSQNVKGALDELSLGKVDIGALSSNITLYPTTAASDITNYVRMVTDIDDNDYNDTAVDISTGTITGNAQLIASLASDAGLITGNPGVINITTLGNIRKTDGNSNQYAEFYFEIYIRNSSGTETLAGTSSTTGAVNPEDNTYYQFSATSTFNPGEVLTTDRIVIKYYANLLGNTGSEYDFQFGGTSPVRTLLPVPVSVIPINPASSIPTDISNFNGILSSSDTNVQAALETIDDHNHDDLYYTETEADGLFVSAVSGAASSNDVDAITTATITDGELIFETQEFMHIGDVTTNYAQTAHGAKSFADNLAALSDLVVSENILHSGDADTKIVLTTDAVSIQAGGEEFIKIVEDDTQDYIKLGDGGDIDVNLNDDLFVQGSTGNVGIGDNDPHERLTTREANGRSDFAIYRSGNDLSTNTDIGRISFDSDYTGSPINYAFIKAYSNDLGAVRGSLDLDVKSTSGNIINGLTVYGSNLGPNIGIGTKTPSERLHVIGNTKIEGNLTVTGTTTTINTNEVNIADNVIKINSDLVAQVANGSAAGDNSSTNTDGGIEVKRYEWDGDSWEEANYFLQFVENTEDFRIGKAGELQAVATREDTPTDESLQFWNATENRLDSSGAYWDDTNGRLGIGTSSPTGKLNIVDGTTKGLEFEEITGGIMRILAYDRTNTAEVPLELRGDTVAFETNGTRRMFINDTGVGIGTESPDEILHVNTGGSGSILIESSNTGSANLLFGDADSNSSGRVRYDHNADDLGLWTNGNERLTIDSSGNIGIGKTTPTSLLDIAGRFRTYEASQIALKTYPSFAGGEIVSYQSVSGSPYTKTLDIVANADSTVPADMRFFTKASGSSAATQAMHIDTSGNVGIGNNNPGVKLDVSGTIRGLDSIRVNTVAANGTPYFGLYQAGTEKAYIQYVDNGASTDNLVIQSDGNFEFNGGNVGIGISSPDSKLHVNATGRAMIVGGDPAGSPAGTIATQTSYLELVAGSGGNTNSSGLIFHNPGVSTSVLEYVNTDANNGYFNFRTDDSSFLGVRIAGNKVATESWVTSQSYLTSYTESQTFDAVTDLGNTTTNEVTTSAYNLGTSSSTTTKATMKYDDTSKSIKFTFS